MSALRRHPDNGALRRRHLSTPGRRPPRGCRNLWKVSRRKPDERRRRGRSPRSPRPLPSRRRRGSRNRPRACAHPGPLLPALALVACSLTLLVVASLLARVALLAGLTGGRDVEAFLALRDLHGPRMAAAKTTVIAHAKTGDGGGGRGLLGANGPDGDRQRVRETQTKAVRTHTAL